MKHQRNFQIVISGHELKCFNLNWCILHVKHTPTHSVPLFIWIRHFDQNLEFNSFCSAIPTWKLMNDEKFNKMVFGTQKSNLHYETRTRITYFGDAHSLAFVPFISYFHWIFHRTNSTITTSELKLFEVLCTNHCTTAPKQQCITTTAMIKMFTFA